ncbi:MAG: phosphoribosyltransferase [Brucellaceae bacterium]|nr:phosphoribosyltransferase [Notoacmeibacter sp.]MCC0026040.1 phosphoribosyltransferase [Brucellaceae bacterium]
MAFVFEDRAEAGRKLVAALDGRDWGGAVVYALPRGGVPVAAEIARAFGLPLDLLLVRKIGAPGHPELALGAVVDGAAPDIAINEDVAASYGFDEADVREMAKAHLAEIERRHRLYLEGRPPIPATGRTAIVVDDGIATGASLMAALHALARRQPARIVLAIPVAPPETLARLRPLADEVVCLEAPAHFYAVGAHYRSFAQVDDDEVVSLLRALR